MPTEYNVYTDESSIRNCRFFLIGGLWVDRLFEPTIRIGLKGFRAQSGMTRELKWNKVSSAKLQEYKDFVSLASKNTHVRFKCIVVDTHLFDTKRYPHPDKELSFFKFYYLLLSRNLAPDEAYYVTTDQLLTRKSDLLSDLRNACNNWFLREHPGLTEPPIRNLQPADSKNEELIQLTDVLLGSVAYAFHGHVGSAAKKALCEHVCECFKVPKLDARCGNLKFNVWPWQPK